VEVKNINGYMIISKYSLNMSMPSPYKFISSSRQSITKNHEQNSRLPLNHLNFSAKTEELE
jgi:hypothetical protein